MKEFQAGRQPVLKAYGVSRESQIIQNGSSVVLLERGEMRRIRYQGGNVVSRQGNASTPDRSLERFEEKSKWRGGRRWSGELNSMVDAGTLNKFFKNQ